MAGLKSRSKLPKQFYLMAYVSDYFSLIGSLIPILLKDVNYPIKLKFIGYLQGREGLYCGFDLLEANKGKNNGEVDGIFYFRTETMMSGLFVPFYKVQGELDLVLSKYEEDKKKPIEPSDLTEGLIAENECLKRIVENQQILTEEFSKLVSEIDPTIATWETEMAKKQKEIEVLLSENLLLRQNLSEETRNNGNFEDGLETPFKISENVSKMTPIALSKNILLQKGIEREKSQESPFLRKSSSENL